MQHPEANALLRSFACIYNKHHYYITSKLCVGRSTVHLGFCNEKTNSHLPEYMAKEDSPAGNRIELPSAVSGKWPVNEANYTTFIILNCYICYLY